MDITWLGHSALRIQATQVTLVTDPYDASVGITMPRTRADIVTVSHEHPHHSHTQAIDGEPRILRGPGEYEIANFYISGLATPRQPPRTEESPDEDEQDARQINTVFTFRGEGLNICHLGDINRELSPRQAEELNQTDVLIAPVGGKCTIGVDKVAQLINLISPRIVIPVHYLTEGLKVDLEPLDRFLGEMGTSEVSPQTRLSITATSLPRDLSIVQLQRVAS